jgi:hypothetical protein
MLILVILVICTKFGTIVVSQNLVVYTEIHINLVVGIHIEVIDAMVIDAMVSRVNSRGGRGDGRGSRGDRYNGVECPTRHFIL